MHVCCGSEVQRNSLQQSHFRQKGEEDGFGNEINNGDLKHLLPKQKVMFTKCHIDCPEELIVLKSTHNKQ